MSAPRTYLDWNATAPLRPEAKAAMLAALEQTGNPSSVHAEGRRVRAIVERARKQVAALVGAETHNVIFTSGATEAATHVLSRHWLGDGIDRPAGRLYVSAIEHPCVLAGGRFAPDQITVVPVTPAGLIDISVLNQQLERHDRASGRPLVALMLANNETGIVQPVAEAAPLVHASGGYLVCDAVQAAGRIPVDLKTLGADAIFLSAHKLGGPKGVGALVLADEAVAPAPLIRGGGQERGHRAGTENVASIAGFGAAAEAARAELDIMPKVAALRDRLEDGISLSKTGVKLKTLLDFPVNEQEFIRNFDETAAFSDGLATSQHHHGQSARRQGRIPRHPDGPCRHCGQCRLSLLVGQGQTQPCA